MSDNRCLVGRLKLGPVIERTKLRSAEIAGHTLVVGDHYDDGVLGFHIPEGAIVPDHLLEDMWLLGRLAGKQKNRVKSRVVGGVFSDGLFYGSQYYQDGHAMVGSRSWNHEWREGQDVALELGITFPA